MQSGGMYHLQHMENFGRKKEISDTRSFGNCVPGVFGTFGRPCGLFDENTEYIYARLHIFWRSRAMDSDQCKGLHKEHLAIF